MSKVGIIGHFGGRKKFLDGQTVKTKTLYQELKNRGKDIYVVDTYLNNTNKIKLLINSMICILKCDTVIILLSRNGMRIYFPLMYWAKKMLKKKIFHDVIGGNLTEYVEIYPQYRKYLNAFDENWVEFEQLKIALEKEGVINCKVIPNFKNLNLSEAHLKINDESKHKICMFSRVMKEKGIVDAIETVHNYNEENQYKFHLNIWGPIEEEFRDEFEEMIEKYPKDFSYKGIVNYNMSVETLTDHIALLFPTYWKGEGFPGTIIDAYAAGLPVIATDWNANSELIDNFKTGWVYPNDKCWDLKSSLEWMALHLDELILMRRNSYEKATCFLPEKWINEILNKID